jgi:type I restriction-modification system DNA methylase subunit
MIGPYRGRVCDPCCGSGGMFVHSIRPRAGIEAVKKQTVGQTLVNRRYPVLRTAKSRWTYRIEK